MKTWLITDTHFGHQQMVQWCNRPEDFSAQIFKNLEMIMPGDLIIHLGDFCIGKDANWHKAWFTALPEAKRILIRGNHDKRSNSWYMEHGWHLVCDSFTLNTHGKRILFSHIPQKDNGQFDLNIHGHFHNTLHRLLEARWVTPTEEERNKDDLKVLTPKHRLLAIEYTDYKPVQLTKFLNSKP